MQKEPDFALKPYSMPNINDLSKRQDKELVELLIDDSHEALGEMYSRYKDRLMYLCKQYIRNEADAEDIVHDIFLKLWETRRFLNPELSFSGYLHTITENYVKDKLRHIDVRVSFAKNILVDARDSTNETEDTIINNDYTELLDELIESLPPMQKKVFQLSRIEGLKYKEIADLLQISVHTVQEYASLASKKMEKKLRQHTDILKMITALLMSVL